MKRVPRDYRTKILESVVKLITFPNCESLDIKSLSNHNYGFRLRVARYRVLFDNLETLKIIEIQEVKKRDKHTY